MQEGHDNWARARGDGEPFSVSMRIVEELAAKSGCQPTAIDPLANSIDPDALEAIVTTSENITVSFEHAGCDIEVSTRQSNVSLRVTRQVQRID